MTLAERFIAAFRLPYALGCVLIGFGLFGTFNTLLSKFVQTSDLRQAIVAPFLPQNLAQSVLIAYAFYAPRYMRTKLLAAERSLPPFLPENERGFQEVFARVSSSRPQVFAWILFLVALLLAVSVSAFFGAPSTIVLNLDPGSLLDLFAGILDVVSLAVVTLALSSVVWTYWSISTGIRRLSSAPLALRPYYEDAFLGLKPIGYLALSMASVYFGFIALLVIAVLTSPSTPTIGDILGVGGFLFGLILLGVLLFFLPLNATHGRMIAEKRAERIRISPMLGTLFQDPTKLSSNTDSGHVLRLDMMDRKVSAMATWPFDVGIVGRLSVIAISVTAILISRIIALILHI